MSPEEFLESEKKADDAARSFIVNAKRRPPPNGFFIENHGVIKQSYRPALEAFMKLSALREKLTAAQELVFCAMVINFERNESGPVEWSFERRFEDARVLVDKMENQNETP